MVTVIQARPLLFAALFAACSLACALIVGGLVESRLPNYRFTALPRAGTSERGQRLFSQSCAHCHGDDARGNGEDGDGPDLSRLRIGNARIAAIIRKGIPGEMPSFDKKHSSLDITDLTAYLRSLR
jgi:mono/diheme cytochrome c family protein